MSDNALSRKDQLVGKTEETQISETSINIAASEDTMLENGEASTNEGDESGTSVARPGIETCPDTKQEEGGTSTDDQLVDQMSAPSTDTQHENAETFTNDQPATSGKETPMSKASTVIAASEDAKPIQEEKSWEDEERDSTPTNFMIADAESSISTVIDVRAAAETSWDATSKSSKASSTISRGQRYGWSFPYVPCCDAPPFDFSTLFRAMFINNVRMISVVYGMILDSTVDNMFEGLVDHPFIGIPLWCIMAGMAILSFIPALPEIAIRAAIAGACVEALRNYGITFTNAAARQTVIASLAGASASVGAILVAGPVFLLILGIFNMSFRPLLSILFVMITSVGSTAVNGAVASMVSGQDVIVGAKCGAVFGACVVLPAVWLGSGRSYNLFYMLSIPLAILALKVSVPNYQYNLVGTGSLMGFCGMGPIASVADTFPNPPADQ
ncbi:hypothetical protein HDU96_009018 [Phlyctochytrium bullatum]|nr:hypothetical protein HDU96_009018 [Phlyctochytrium bullatum]